MAAAAQHDVDLAEDPFLQQQLQPQHAGRARRIQHIEVDRKAAFHVGQLVDAFLQQLGVDIAAFGHQHDPHRGIALVAHVFENRQFLVGDQLGQLLDQLGLGHHVGHLGNHQLPLPASQPFDPAVFPHARRIAPGGKAPAHPQRALAGFIGARNRLGTVDHQPAGGEVGALHQLHQRGMFGVGVVDQQQGGVDDLGYVVAGNAGRHADRNAGCAIGQQVGEQAGEDFGLFLLAVVGGNKVHRPLVQPGHQLDRGAGQPGFGIAVGGGIIAVDIAEIALPFDQRIAQRKILR